MIQILGYFLILRSTILYDSINLHRCAWVRLVSGLISDRCLNTNLQTRHRVLQAATSPRPRRLRLWSMPPLLFLWALALRVRSLHISDSTPVGIILSSTPTIRPVVIWQASAATALSSDWCVSPEVVIANVFVERSFCTLASFEALVASMGKSADLLLCGTWLYQRWLATTRNGRFRRLWVLTANYRRCLVSPRNRRRRNSCPWWQRPLRPVEGTGDISFWRTRVSGKTLVQVRCKSDVVIWQPGGTGASRWAEDARLAYMLCCLDKAACWS